MTNESASIKIGKLDAARRQIQTAIQLWFNGGDPVSIHTLAFAAYEIVHAISKRRDPARMELLFDAPFIKPEHRREYAVAMKKHASFFKHADTDGEAVIEFHPEFSESFILFTVVGLELCGERKSAEETTYLLWFHIHSPEMLSQEGEKFIADTFPPHILKYLKGLPKAQFWKEFGQLRA
jgi:hypothetical protein